MRRSLIVAGALVATIALTAPAHGHVHLRLIKSAPAKDAAVFAPDEIRLWYSVEPELAVSRITVADADGAEARLGEVKAGSEHSLATAVTDPLEPGVYSVYWRTSSGDGHRITGTFGFSVVAPK